MMDNPAQTVSTVAKPHLFGPGNNANPRGRPKGSRNRLGEEFVAALRADFEKHGVDVIEKVRVDAPARYLAVIARVIPQEIKIDEVSALEGIDSRILDAIVRLVSDPGRIAGLAAGRGDGSQALVIEGEAVEPVGRLSPVPEASVVPRAWPDVAGEVAARGQPAREDPRGRNGNGHAPDGDIPGSVARS